MLIASGTSRINLLDHRRPWARANLNAPGWNLVASYTGETSNGMTDLGSGARSYLDTHRLALEGQWHGAFARDRVHVVAGAAVDALSLDTADPSGRQTILEAKERERGRAVFAQLDLAPWTAVKLVGLRALGRHGSFAVASLAARRDRLGSAAAAERARVVLATRSCGRRSCSARGGRRLRRLSI